MRTAPPHSGRRWPADRPRRGPRQGNRRAQVRGIEHRPPGGQPARHAQPETFGPPVAVVDHVGHHRLAHPVHVHEGQGLPRIAARQFGGQTLPRHLRHRPDDFVGGLRHGGPHGRELLLVRGGGAAGEIADVRSGAQVFEFRRCALAEVLVAIAGGAGDDDAAAARGGAADGLALGRAEAGLGGHDEDVAPPQSGQVTGLGDAPRHAPQKRLLESHDAVVSHPVVQVEGRGGVIDPHVGAWLRAGVEVFVLALEAHVALQRLVESGLLEEGRAVAPVARAQRPGGREDVAAARQALGHVELHRRGIAGQGDAARGRPQPVGGEDHAVVSGALLQAPDLGDQLPSTTCGMSWFSSMPRSM